MLILTFARSLIRPCTSTFVCLRCRLASTSSLLPSRRPRKNEKKEPFDNLPQWMKNFTQSYNRIDEAIFTRIGLIERKFPQWSEAHLTRAHNRDKVLRRDWTLIYECQTLSTVAGASTVFRTIFFAMVLCISGIALYDTWDGNETMTLRRFVKSFADALRAKPPQRTALLDSDEMHDISSPSPDWLQHDNVEKRWLALPFSAHKKSTPATDAIVAAMFTLVMLTSLALSCLSWRVVNRIYRHNTDRDVYILVKYRAFWPWRQEITAKASELYRTKRQMDFERKNVRPIAFLRHILIEGSFKRRRALIDARHFVLKFDFVTRAEHMEMFGEREVRRRVQSLIKRRT